MSLCAAGISSGSIVMFHIPGITPEATLFNDSPEVITYGNMDRKRTHEILNQSASTTVDVIVLGCPHYSLDRISKLASLLEGKKLHENTKLYVTVAHAQKAISDRMGYTNIIQKAGAIILEDTCGTLINIEPSKVLASDSAKIIHYISRMTGVKNTLLGSLEECVVAATSGKWTGSVLE
ncbi:MAG: aconitase X catalytic domain-containing protein, partial [Clostridiales bacterium]|jgi:predicted aconitase|nr:aconitase X catalytic domain-containing protein [Clostridiales bacterium]